MLDYFLLQLVHLHLLVLRQAPWQHNLYALLQPQLVQVAVHLEERREELSYLTEVLLNFFQLVLKGKYLILQMLKRCVKQQLKHLDIIKPSGGISSTFWNVVALPPINDWYIFILLHISWSVKSMPIFVLIYVGLGRISGNTIFSAKISVNKQSHSQALFLKFY